MRLTFTMKFTRNPKIIFAITALLFATLACRAATRLIIPDTPTPLPSPTATLLPTLTPTVVPTTTSSVSDVSCPLITDRIITDATSSSGGNALSGESTSNPDVTHLVFYAVTGDELKNPYFEPVAKSFSTEQKDRVTQKKIWEYFTRLIPHDQRTLLNGYSVFTDGKANLLASVNQSNTDPIKWELNVDIADSSQKTSLTFTLIHEFGHLLTLNSNQVNVSLPVYNHPDDSNIYDAEVAACPQYFTGEGCSKPDSYINVFFQRYWTDFYAEWQKIDAIKNDNTRQNKLDDFYKTYQDQFVTDYAPTSPAEDIAESWAFFILAPKPEATSIANEKILFFYEYPELVALRSQILNSVCVEFQQ
jgi:hypothetical protein